MTNSCAVAVMVAAAGALALVGGIGLLRAAARARSKTRLARTIGGWGLVGAGLALWRLCAATELAGASYALAFSLMGYGAVALSLQRRSAHHRRPQQHRAEDPLEQSRRPWCWAARLLLAGPMSLAFAIAVALLVSTRAPLAAVNAVVLGGFLAAVAFAGAMAWSLAAQRLSRVSIGLGLCSVLMTGLSAWRM